PLIRIVLLGCRRRSRRYGGMLGICRRWLRGGLDQASGFRVGEPGSKCLLADDFHRDRHKGMRLTAKLGALSVVDAFALGLEPRFVEPARNCVDLDAE